MSENNKKICLGCMQEINTDDIKCPHCGFDPNAYKVNPRCLRLGTKLAGKYIIGKVIGEGGFGITYIGWDEKLELPIAIKEFFPPKIASRDTTTGNNTIYMFDHADEKSFEEGMRRSVKEARSMSKLEAYEGIVSIRDFFNENKTAYIIMEYVDGETLKEYLKENEKMEPEDVLKVMKPVMKALEQMHRTGMIHRDISPDNIMIRRDGQVKLIDFGAARVAQEEDEKSLTVMLKRGFSPEEQYRSKGHQGPWTDIYALCATMYYMLTGVIPPESMERVLEDKYVSLKEYDIELDTKIADAIDKGLCVLAKNRYQSMSDLIHDIYGEEEKLVIPKKDMASMEVESAVGETVLDDNSTVLMDDENKTVLMDEAEEINPIVVGKNKIVKFNGKKKIFAVIVLLAIVLVGGTFAFIAQNSGNKEELANVASKENAVTTPTVSPTPTAEITATPEVLMPNLVNQKIEEITPQIQSIQQGANIKTIEVYSNTIPVGNIVSQLPEAGSLLNPSQPLVVTLEVSKGEELMTVPNVKGKSLTTAKSKLKKSGLKLKTKSKYSSSYSKGKVISQNKKASAKVKKNTTIQLVVSKGPKPTKKPQATLRPTVRPQRPTTSSGKSSKKSKKSNKSSDFQVIGSDDYIELN
ncbi:MAG: protein kinase domain-containing protein [Clostridium sp.]